MRAHVLPSSIRSPTGFRLYLYQFSYCPIPPFSFLLRNGSCFIPGFQAWVVVWALVVYGLACGAGGGKEMGNKRASTSELSCANKEGAESTLLSLKPRASMIISWGVAGFLLLLVCLVLKAVVLAGGEGSSPHRSCGHFSRPQTHIFFRIGVRLAWLTRCT